MSRLKMLLHVSNLSTCNTQQPPLHRCEPVAQHAHTTQQGLLHVASLSPCDTQQAEEFEVLLKAVGPAYDTPAEQYAVIRAAAAGDMAAALESYRAMAERNGLTIH